MIHEKQPGKGGTTLQLSFYLDGAHTRESMSACGDWFADTLAGERKAEAASVSASASATSSTTPTFLHGPEIREICGRFNKLSRPAVTAVDKWCRAYSQVGGPPASRCTQLQQSGVRLWYKNGVFFCKDFEGGCPCREFKQGERASKRSD